MAWFSSDRTIREYAEDVWHVPVRPSPLTTRQKGAQRAGG
jgi:starch phosphorylase